MNTPRSSVEKAIARMALVFAIVVAAVGTTISGQVVLSTLGDTIANSASVSATSFKAMPFVTATTGSFKVSSVTIVLGTPVNTSGNLFVAIAPDIGKPDLANKMLLSGTSNPTTAGSYAFTASSIILAANTTYWLVLGVSSGAGAYTWSFSIDDTYQVSTWPTIDEIAASGNSGSTWTIVPGTSSTPYLFSLNASAIPETANLAEIAGILALGAVWLREVRRRRAMVG